MLQILRSRCRIPVTRITSLLVQRNSGRVERVALLSDVFIFLFVVFLNARSCCWRRINASSVGSILCHESDSWDLRISLTKEQIFVTHSIRQIEIPVLLARQLGYKHTFCQNLVSTETSSPLYFRKNLTCETLACHGFVKIVFSVFCKLVCRWDKKSCSFRNDMISGRGRDCFWGPLNPMSDGFLGLFSWCWSHRDLFTSSRTWNEFHFVLCSWCDS